MAEAMSGTEAIGPSSRGLETRSDADILALLSDAQERAVAAVRRAHGEIAAAAEALADRAGRGGRIVYTGAGSSGLIAALDGMELAGTFGWPDDRIAFVLASGDRIVPLTGAEEDDPDRAAAGITALGLGPADVVIAVAASGATPFTLAAVAAAKDAGAFAIGLANNPGTPLLAAVDLAIFLDSGPEVVVGSTRMSAGTAQKAALGMISSLAMMRLGRTHDGMMVDLRADNDKLRRRTAATVAAIAGCDGAAAGRALAAAGGSVKRAVLVARGMRPAEAQTLLDAAQGNLRAALATIQAGTGGRRAGR